MLAIVSVIIATYNRKDLLCEAIQSVLSQPYPDFELIIVDDGSSDGTQTMVAGFNDSRIKYIYQSNQGRSHARNAGIRLAKGKYIAFLDSDDVYLPHKLFLQVEHMDKHPQVGMIYTSAWCINEQGHVTKKGYTASVSGAIYKYIAFFLPVTITLPTVMVRKEIFELTGLFDENMHRFEDTDMWRRISKITTIHAIDNPTCLLRTHSGNHLHSQNPEQLISALHYYVNKVLREDESIDFTRKNQRIGGLYYYYAKALMNVPNWKNYGAELLHRAYHYWPWYRISWLAKSISTHLLKSLGIYKTT